MFTDIIGYTKLMQRSESEAIQLRNRHREVFDSLHESYLGRIIHYYGDGTLSIFESAGDGVRCAIEIQRQLRRDPEVPLRIGIHLGEIIMTDDDIIGDNVNIASRIESLGTAGVVLISQKVVEEIKNQDNIPYQFLGNFHFKNDTHPRGIYALASHGILVPSPDQLSGKLEQEVTAVSRIGSLRVISKTSTLGYKNSKKTISDIAKELRVDAIIEGSVSRRDNNVQLNLQLLRAFPKEDHIWAEVYDCPLENIYSLLNEITQTISEKIDLLLTRKESQRLSSSDRVNPEAYEAYLRGKIYVEKLSYESLKISMEYLEKAISIDPNFAPAYAAVVFSLSAQVQMGFIPPPEAMPKIYKALHKSLSLDPDFAGAHFSKAGIHAWTEWDWQQSEIEFLKGFDIDPGDSVAMAYYGHVLMLLKRFEEAIEKVNKALEIDPNNALVQLLSAKVFYGDGQIERGLELAKRSFQIDPNNRSLLRNMDMIFYHLGDYPQSIETQKRILHREPESLAALETGYADKDYKKAMITLARTREKLSHQQFIPPVWVAIAYNRAGLYEDAIRWLERGLQIHDQDMPYIFIMHEFEQLRQDKRFQRIAEKIGVPL
jgi:tetratricopeptide (TPR) repeat protein